jgi:alcohol dehydrogenase class IV
MRNQQESFFFNSSVTKTKCCFLIYPAQFNFTYYVNIPHGVANAIMLPYVMRFNIKACPEKFVDIAKALGASNTTAKGAVEAVNDLSKALQIPSLRSYKVEEKDLARLAKDALGRNSNYVTNPRTMNEKDAIDVYRKALEEE